MIPNFFDMFKLGSVLKPIDDKEQYLKFKNE